MQHRRLIGTAAQPLGAQHSAAPAISRRIFLGATVSAPVTLAVAIGASGKRKSIAVAPLELEFLEDSDGMRVVGYRNECPVSEWRLHRRAFGPNASFLLRTLKSGADRGGYELLVKEVQSAAVSSSRHYFTFLHTGDRVSWRIRMRTELWGTELTSLHDVDFGALTREERQQTIPDCRPLDRAPTMLSANPNPNSNTTADSNAPLGLNTADSPNADLTPDLDPKPALPPLVIYRPVFEFSTHASAINAALQVMFEGHLRGAGPLNLTFDADCVWSLFGPNLKQLVIHPYGVDVDHMEFAWTDRTGLHPPHVGTSADPDPVFFAGAVLKRDPAPIVLEGTRSVQGLLVPASPLAFTFLSDTWRKDSKYRAPAIVRLTGQWMLSVKSAGRTALRDILVNPGTLATSRGSQAEFISQLTGTLATEPRRVQSRVGGFKIKGWTANSKSTTSDLPGVEVFFDGNNSNAAARLRSINLPLLLLESELAPSGTDFSRLSLAPTLVNAFYREDSKEISDVIGESGSFLWLGHPDALPNSTVLRLNLARARLDIAHSEDLMSLGFMFAGLFLILDKNGTRIESGTVLCPPEAGARSGPELAGGGQTDVRPILVVEFPPQHMFEEALFRPGLPDLPDITPRQLQTMKIPSALARTEFPKPECLRANESSFAFSLSPDELLKTLDSLGCTENRNFFRDKFAQLKIAKENDYNGPFTQFHRQFKAKFQAPDDSILDQSVYIGPYGMDPDVRAQARKLMSDSAETILSRHLEEVLSNANEVVLKLRAGEPESDTDNFIVRLAKRFTNRSAETYRDVTLRNEIAVSKVLADYDAFRDFYREQMGKLLAGVFPESPETEDLAKSIPPNDLEFFSKDNRLWAKPGDLSVLQRREDWVKKAYFQTLSGKDPIPSSVRARLSEPSRLAFRLPCGSTQTSREHSARLPHVFSINFELSHLTNWGRYELAVAPRARAIVPLDEGGRPTNESIELAAENQTSSAETNGSSTPEKESEGVTTTVVTEPTEIQQQGSAKTAESADMAMLRMLNFRSGQYVTAEERLSEVAASLIAPNPWETSIEIPARLILSPSQRAIWRTPRKITLPPAEAGTNCSLEAPRRSSHLPQRTTDVKLRLPTPVPLWNAALATNDSAPSVRAIYSPDLRPGFVHKGLDSLARLARAAQKAPEGAARVSNVALPGAPPRGIQAPWTLGREESDQTAESVDHIAAALKSDADGHPLVKYLRTRQSELAPSGKSRNRLFRSSLDACDRHELVILSSVWGLPVRGRREQNGQLQAADTSSQVEPTEGFQLIDLEPGSAVYRPRPLKIQELRLSALGGTLRHDTEFVPPSQARHIEYGPLFDALSIERWQHWAVLGRDVFAEVVYKGYLFPIGHRASLIKQTERIFLRGMRRSGKPGTIRAFLRQRLFIRIGDPLKHFPALGQPNLGRQFPASEVRILTLNSPDIVDPTADFAKPLNETPPKADPDQDIYKAEDPSPAGRLFAPFGGLVFWPRTARISGAEVRFDMLIDDSLVRWPLLFVDNVAVNNEKIIRSVVDYYNNHITSPDQQTPAAPRPVGSDQTQQSSSLPPIDSDLHRRTLDFASQSHRYCDELKPGSATHRTLYWTLKASGGVRTSAPTVPESFPNYKDPFSWEGTNTKFDDPSLEAVDQPPFYPALETARIRLDQVERMTGQSNVPVLVQFDGFYIAKGFVPSPAPSDATPPSARDPLEIYLTILNDVGLSMGAAGDRSGALYQPGSHLVALSRQRGPLGGQQNDSRVFAGTLFSRVGEYGGGRKTEDSKKSFQAYFPAVDEAKARDQSTSLLSTKLFGLVSLHELIKVLNSKNLGEAAQSLPVLREVVQYGAAGAEAGADFVRNSVIVPLQQIVVDIRAKWDELGKRVLKLTTGLGQWAQLSLGDVFPEIDAGLKDFESALRKSAAERDDISFYSGLSEVYESGRGLVDALSRASANPIERAYLSVASKASEKLASLEKAAHDLSADFEKATRSSLLDEQLAQMILGPGASLDAFGNAMFLHIPIDTNVDVISIKNSLRQHLSKVVEAARSKAESVATVEAHSFVADLQARVTLSPDDTVSVTESFVPLFDTADALARGLASADINRLAQGAHNLLVLFLTPLMASDTPWWLEFVNVLRETKNSVYTTINFILSDSDKDNSSFGQQWRSLEKSLPLADHNPVVGKARDAREALAKIALEIRGLLRGYEDVGSAMHVSTWRVDELHAAIQLRGELLIQSNELLRSLLDPASFEATSDVEVGKALQPIVRSILQIQQKAYESAQSLLNVIAPASKDDASRAQKVLEVANDKAVEASSKVARWSEWVALRAELVRTLPLIGGERSAPDPIGSLDRYVAIRIVALWGARMAKAASSGSSAVAAAVRSAAKIAVTTYQPMLEARNKLYAAVNPLAPRMAAVLLAPISGKDVATTTPDNDQLASDVQILKELQKPGDLSQTQYESVQSIVQSWRDNTATPIRILQQAHSLSIENVRAQLLSLIDFTGYYEQLEALIRQLIPTSTSLTYDFGLNLDESAADATAGVFVPEKGCRLTVNSTTTVDLRNPKVTFNSVGELGPFNIILIGTLIKAVKIRFDGARFESNGASTHCDVRYRDFQILEALKFVEALAKWFQPKEGSGFYLVPLSGALGIEAGYGLSIGTISLANVSFFNISLNAAVRLPFESGKEATFVASLSRRDSPFTISAAPYGGSGFFGIEADAKGIVGFEASFEYGGAGAFSYGPLSGQGRLMIGIYVRQKKERDRTVTDIYATFFAGGSASIWIFSFGASLYVCASMHGTTMVGDATFTFSFSMGLVDFDFRVSVHKELTWGGGGGGTSGRIDNLHPKSDPYVWSDHGPLVANELDVPMGIERAELRVDSWCQSEHWGQHRRYTDFSIDIDIEDFA
jgi:hypothetical protein